MLVRANLPLAPEHPRSLASTRSCLDSFVVYVGLTQTGLSTRLGHYRRGHKRQRTSARVKALIGQALAAGHTVEVLIATPEPLLWNGLPVNTAAGLEAGLIRKLRPLWNMLGAGR